MEQKPAYSSSAEVKSSVLQDYKTEMAKINLEKLMGAELTPAIDFNAYKASKKEDKPLARHKSTKLSTSPESGQNRNQLHPQSAESDSPAPISQDSLDEDNMGHDNTRRDDATKLLGDYTSSFKKH